MSDFRVSVLFRWGPQLEQATYKNRQRLYLSEQVSLLFFFYAPFFCSWNLNCLQFEERILYMDLQFRNDTPLVGELVLVIVWLTVVCVWYIGLLSCGDIDCC